MNRVRGLFARIEVAELVAVLALLVLGVGVALVASPGWALIVMSTLVLVYIVLPDQRAAEK